MARTKDPSAATKKAWITRHRNAKGGGSATTASKGDWRSGPKQLSFEGMTSDSPEVVALAKSAYARAAKAEPSLTSLVTSVAKVTGGTPVGLKHRLKADRAIAGKIIRDSVEKSIPPSESVAQLTDINRYTVAYDAKSLVGQGKAAIAALQRAGWEPYDHKTKNYFGPGDAYDGFNAVYVNKKTGHRFELQFHTPESLKIKGKAHVMFEEYRSTAPTDTATRSRLWSQMTALWDNYDRPVNYELLPGRRMEVGQ